MTQPGIARRGGNGSMDREKMIKAAQQYCDGIAFCSADEPVVMAADFAIEQVKEERKRIAKDLTEAHEDDCSGYHCVVCHFVKALEAE